MYTYVCMYKLCNRLSSDWNNRCSSTRWALTNTSQKSCLGTKQRCLALTVENIEKIWGFESSLSSMRVNFIYINFVTLNKREMLRMTLPFELEVWIHFGRYSLQKDVDKLTGIYSQVGYLTF